MLFVNPKYCSRCKKPRKVDIIIWPKLKVINGNQAWLCRMCQKDMEKLLDNWMDFEEKKIK